MVLTLQPKTTWTEHTLRSKFIVAVAARLRGISQNQETWK
jgi:hypothetical protein